MNEKRKRRSRYKGTALSFQLEACAKRAGLDAMLLARHDGLLVANSPYGNDDSESIAASLSSIAGNRFFVGKLRSDEGAPHTVAARAFEVRGESLVLCAVGNPTDNTLDEMYHAMKGVTRILG